MRGVFHSIRFLLPAALLVLIAGVLLAAAELGGRRFGRSDVESRASWIEAAASLATTSIGLDLSRGQLDDAAAAVRKLESLGDVSLALLIDGRGRILASTAAGWTGQSLDRSPFAPDAAAIQSVWAGGPSVLRVRHGDRFVFALAIPAAVAPGGARPDAALVLGLDLSGYPGRAHAQAYRFFAFVALGALLILSLVAGFLHRAVAAPAFRLADTADRFAAGDRTARARIEGASEIRRAGEAFNRLGDRLAEIERDRRAQERLLDALLRTLPVGVIAVRRSDRQIVFLNPHWQEMFGPSFAPGVSVDAALEGTRCLGAGGAPLALDELPIRAVLETARPTAIVPLSIVRPDAARIPVLTRAVPLALAREGEIDAALGVAQDRREVERAVAELRRTERQLGALLASLNVGVVMVTREDRRVLFCNRRFTDLTDRAYRPGDAWSANPPHVERADGREFDPDQDTLSQVIRSGERTTRADLLVVRANGDRIPVLETSAPVNLSGGAGFDAVVTVIQERRELEHALEELRAWEKRFESATEATGQAVYEWDLDTDVCRFSGALETVFGWRAEDVDTNEKWNLQTHPEDLPKVRAEFAGSLREGQMFDGIYRFRHRDGRWLWVRDRGLATRDPAGRPVRVIGAVADVTEQREMEERLRQAQKMETVGTLAGGIAHDFNNQLTALLGYLTLLDQGMVEESARPEHMRLARSAAERCAELTRGLLAFSRMLPSDLQRTSVNEVVHDTAALLARMVPASIQVRLHLAVDLPEAMVDSVQLQQVLFNLFVNARDAMPEGGTLTVRSRRVEIAPGDPGGLDAGTCAEISISDTGVGIPADVLPRIFEPFFTTKPVGSGTGLGLAMVYGIVSQHHGRVEVTSEPGWGSTFRVLLPAAPGEARPAPGGPAAAPAKEPEQQRPAPPLEGLPVLVVDDEPLVRGFAQRALEVAGCRVIAVAGGDEGLRAMREAAVLPAVVLMDLTMPGRPVREVLHELRELAPETPVVLTSGFSQQSSARDELPGLPFLPKPYSPGQLVEAIRAALEGAASRAS